MGGSGDISNLKRPLAANRAKMKSGQIKTIEEEEVSKDNSELVINMKNIHKNSDESLDEGGNNNSRSNREVIGIIKNSNNNYNRKSTNQDVSSRYDKNQLIEEIKEESDGHSEVEKEKMIVGSFNDSRMDSDIRLQRAKTLQNTFNAPSPV